MPRRLFILLPLVCLLIACQPVRDARQTIAVADSLRVNEGITCDDSLALANAYTTLGHWRLIYPDDYARSCYYYGRMLRNRNDQVAAMQAFICGMHAPYVQRFIPLPHFTDYHILGRIYSNMGTMCHLVDEFELAYLMYENSSAQFCHAGDTTMYYYARNAMALQLAEQNKHIEASWIYLVDGRVSPLAERYTHLSYSYLTILSVPSSCFSLIPRPRPKTDKKSLPIYANSPFFKKYTLIF